MEIEFYALIFTCENESILAWLRGKRHDPPTIEVRDDILRSNFNYKLTVFM